MLKFGMLILDDNFKVPGVPTEGEQSGPPTDEERMRAWEVGHPDYLGADAYDNIQKAIDHALK